MTPTEAVVLTEYVAACCPQQRIGEFTPDAWHDLLGDLDLADCRRAAMLVGKRQPFISPAEIRAEVRRIRGDRIARSVIPAPPAELADDPRAYQRALQAQTRLAGDGELPPAADVIALPGAGRSDDGRPVTLRQAVRDLRRALGPGRPQRPAIGDERQVAREQVTRLRSVREQGENAGGSESA